MGSLISTMAAISTPLIFLILPLLASALQEDRHGQSGGRALQWEQGNHGGPHGSETWYIAPGLGWPHHLQSKRFWRTLIDNPFPNRFGKITKRDMLKKKDKDGQSVDEIMRDDEEQRVEETIRMLQDYLSRGRKYSRFV